MARKRITYFAIKAERNPPQALIRCASLGYGADPQKGLPTGRSRTIRTARAARNDRGHLLVALLQRGAHHGSESEPQCATPERRLEEGQPKAYSQGGANQAADPQGFVHQHSPMPMLTSIPAATLLHPYPPGG